MNPAPQLERCPHCGSDARVAPHAAYRYKCTVCGKPRIPMDANLATTDAGTAELLRVAHRERLAKFGWQMASFGAAVLTVLAALFGAGLSALFDFGLTGNAAVVAMTLVPVVSS